MFSLLHPRVNGIEGVAISDVVSHDYALGTLVVAIRDGSEALLARSVPDLELADFVVAVDRADLEINANCWHRSIVEFIILKSVKATQLASFQ